MRRDIGEFLLSTVNEAQEAIKKGKFRGLAEKLEEACRVAINDERYSDIAERLGDAGDYLFAREHIGRTCRLLDEARQLLSCRDVAT